MWRLEAVDADLAARLGAADPAAQRRMAGAAARAAAAFTGLADPAPMAALHALDNGQVDDAVHTAAAAHAAHLTGCYWDAHDAWADADDEVSAPRPPDTDLDRSCAAQAVAEAVRADPRAAALEAVYFAAIAVGGLAALNGLIRSQRDP
ncbi:hypothetical protein CLV63_112137 [Murinocardiopsis flavida]|uniref:Uncharacterized protein n=2 Tax=Murinocardiopsis flavida TaxID=645275 RepID=A0A2P8DGB0_9ACTN|nr:hypothetical protein CLV63_112137 [Murinocardiopsis flavida]